MQIKQKIIILAGTFYPHILDLFEIKTYDIHVILHEKNPSEINTIYLTHGLTNQPITIGTNFDLENSITTISPDIIISIGWRFILKKAFFTKFSTSKIINIHPALLPEYKGYHTEPFIVMNNESEHGITAHYLTEDLDAGDIILQVKFPINSFSTVKSIKKQVENLMPGFFSSLLQHINANPIESYPQTGVTKIVAPKRTPDDSLIDATKSLEELYNIIRASDPESFPAFFIKEGERVYIKLWTNRQSKNKFEL